MINIKYFSKYREWMETPGDVLDASPANIGELKNLLLARYANAAIMLADVRCIVAVNHQVVQGDEFLLASGDEVAFYPPVTGG
jgi:molybdopterin synthase sulfur carrier subunit